MLRDQSQGFPLAGIGQLVAAATSKNAAAKIQDGYPPTTTTGGAEEPRAFAAEMAVRPLEMDGIVFALPILTAAAVPIGEDNSIFFAAHSNSRNHAAVM